MSSAPANLRRTIAPTGMARKNARWPGGLNWQRLWMLTDTLPIDQQLPSVTSRRPPRSLAASAPLGPAAQLFSSVTATAYEPPCDARDFRLWPLPYGTSQPAQLVWAAHRLDQPG
jgi:hypothetical protein